MKLVIDLKKKLEISYLKTKQGRHAIHCNVRGLDGNICEKCPTRCVDISPRRYGRDTKVQVKIKLMF